MRSQIAVVARQVQLYAQTIFSPPPCTLSLVHSLIPSFTLHPANYPPRHHGSQSFLRRTPRSSSRLCHRPQCSPNASVPGITAQPPCAATRIHRCQVPRDSQAVADTSRVLQDQGRRGRVRGLTPRRRVAEAPSEEGHPGRQG